MVNTAYGVVGWFVEDICATEKGRLFLNGLLGVFAAVVEER